MDQLEFSLEISGDRSGYRIRAASPYRDVVSAEFALPWDEDTLSEQLYRVENAVLRGSGRRRSRGALEEETVRTFGAQLFDAAFPGDVRSAFYDAVENARSSNSRLRVKLALGPPELANLPWEFLFDQQTPDFVVLSKTTPLVRHLSVGKPTPRLTVAAPLRILGMTCSPAGTQKLDEAGERRRIDEAVRPLVERGVVELVWLEGQTWRDLQEAMERGPWHIFHFVGHGRFDDVADEGTLALADDDGMLYPLRSQQLARLLGDDSALRLVVLNACEGARGDDSKPFSSMAATLVQRGLPAVLAMQYEVSDDAAVEFSRKLYESLADARPLDVAVADARLAVSFAVQDSFEWATPVLYMRAMEGALFSVESVPAPPPGAPPGPEPGPPDPPPAEPPLAEPPLAEPPLAEPVPAQQDAATPEPVSRGNVVPGPDPTAPGGGGEAGAPHMEAVAVAGAPLEPPAPPPVSATPATPAAVERPPAGSSAPASVWKWVAIGAVGLILVFVALAVFGGDGERESSREQFAEGATPIVVDENVVSGELARGQASVLYEYQAPEGTEVVDVAVIPDGDMDVVLGGLDGSNVAREADVGADGGRERLEGLSVADDGSVFVRVAEYTPGSAADGGFTLTFQPLS